MATHTHTPHTHSTHVHTHTLHTHTPHTYTHSTHVHTLHTHTHTLHTHSTHTPHTYTPVDAVGLLGEGAVLLGIGGGGATHDHHGDTDTDLLLIHHIDMILIGRKDRRMYGWLNSYYSSSFSATGSALEHAVVPPPLTCTTVDSLRGTEEVEKRRRRETKAPDHPSRSRRRRNQSLRAVRS